MFNVPLLQVPLEDWYCPNGCYCTERIPPIPPGSSRFHSCPQLHGLNAPLVRVGTDCKVEAVERDDYLGDEIQRHGDDGKAYMAIKTTHADGSNDLAVNAPLATARIVV